MIIFLTVSYLVAVLVMTAAWLQQKRTGNATCVDFYWTILVTCAGVLAYVMGTGEDIYRLLGGVMIGIWGLRLSWHLGERVFKDAEEDGRYSDLRVEMGPRVHGFLFLFLQFQALTIPVFALPHLLIADIQSTQLTPLIAASLLFIISLIGQAIADSQLAEFRRDPSNKHKVCDRGLWALTRHPNYFFEWLISISIALTAIHHPYWYLAWILPLAEYILLRYVTGIPPVERRSLKSRGELYKQYQQRVPAFFPNLLAPFRPQEPSS